MRYEEENIWLTQRMLSTLYDVDVGVINAFAEVEGDYEYGLINGSSEVKITNYNGTDKDITITSILGGKPVTEIGKGAFREKELTSATIPIGITTIGDLAFVMNKLTSITIPDGILTGTWYTDAVSWAADKKIVQSYGNGLFGPNDDVTREQLVTILYNYAKYKEYGTDNTRNIEGFTDNMKVSNWAKEAMLGEWLQTLLLEKLRLHSIQKILQLEQK